MRWFLLPKNCSKPTLNYSSLQSLRRWKEERHRLHFSTNGPPSIGHLSIVEMQDPPQRTIDASSGGGFVSFGGVGILGQTDLCYLAMKQEQEQDYWCYSIMLMAMK